LGKKCYSGCSTEDEPPILDNKEPMVQKTVQQSNYEPQTHTKTCAEERNVQGKENIKGYN
jgi:hypothetical protein